MRPGGTVWRLVERSPWLMRSPSGASATVNSHNVLTRRQTSWRMITPNDTKTATPSPIVD